MLLADPMKINVRVSGALKSHVEHAISEGDYENVSEYVRDLIRKDKATKEAIAFDAVKAELQAAFAVSDDECGMADFDEIKALALAEK